MPDDPTIQAINLQLRVPDFIPSEPLLWFMQVEGQFNTRNNTNELTRYNYVMPVLPMAIAKE